VHRDQAAFKAARGVERRMSLRERRASRAARRRGVPSRRRRAARRPRGEPSAPVLARARFPERRAGTAHGRCRACCRGGGCAARVPRRGACLGAGCRAPRFRYPRRIPGFRLPSLGRGSEAHRINTNAGGGLLAAMTAEAALACCGSVAPAGAGPHGFETKVAEMLVAEWRAAGRSGRPRAIAIVDDAPHDQYLYPEFLLAQSALRRAGFAAVIAPPDALQLRGGALYAADQPVDLVYNRLTDFAFEAPAHHVLREAYLGAMRLSRRIRALTRCTRTSGCSACSAMRRGCAAPVSIRRWPTCSAKSCPPPRWFAARTARGCGRSERSCFSSRSPASAAAARTGATSSRVAWFEEILHGGM